MMRLLRKVPQRCGCSRSSQGAGDAESSSKVQLFQKCSQRSALKGASDAENAPRGGSVGTRTVYFSKWQPCEWISFTWRCVLNLSSKEWCGWFSMHGAAMHQHRSSTIRVDPDMGSVLTCRHRFRREWVLDDRVRPYIIQSGFYVFHRVGHVKVDWPLITALLEKWCPKTHTFHMPVGEMTITLQDVAILFGLRVHGHPVTGSTDINWHALCEELLGVRSTETDIRGASLTICFITTHFSHLPPRVVDEVTLQRRARAYLLLLVGGSLFLDKKGVYIQLAILPMLTDFDETAQYSWGSEH
ncbi:hypothetical protein VitviT2T_008506 [Vitis vinifera]|uniref:Aminotransferase-like plant mobile domain-containing protein n=1 Tax=Vitis vinifera TaxID=29760 RepID=A0ABY9C2U8_VITVI|nr:hypothetical protein VitviT2T_008506 [Vitis vinifera]